MTKLTTILIILVAALAIATTVLLVIVTKKPVKTEDMIRNEVLLEVSERDRLKDSVSYIKVVALYDSLLKASDQRYADLEAKKQPIYNAIKSTRSAIDNFDKEQLRRATAEYVRTYQ